MRFSIWKSAMRAFTAVCLLCSPLLFAADAPPTPPSIETLAAYPAMSGFTVSPDGKHLAALEARGEDRVILVWSTDALSTPPTVIGSKQMKIQRVQFIKNDTLAVSLWQRFDLHFDKTKTTCSTSLTSPAATGASR
jgi:hypothetical protein